MPRTPKKSNDSAATVGYEAQLWQMAMPSPSPARVRRLIASSTREQFDQVYEAILGLMSPAVKKQ